MYFAQAPYPGLRPFEVEEADIFFGREKQTDELLGRLSQTYFLPIIGPSGCGKSSLVRAGLLASLEAGFIVKAGGRWRVLDMMPRDRPLEELAKAIARHLPTSGESKIKELQAILGSGPRGLIDALEQLSLTQGENLLLLVDQFEEVFRFRDPGRSTQPSDHASVQRQRRKDEADAFVAILLETSIKAKNAYVVLTMRSDFLRDCSVFAGLPEAFNESIYLTPRLDRDQLQSAIEEPARVFSGTLEPELVRQIINDAGNNEDQLPLMQHVLMRMWSNALSVRPKNTPTLTLADYKIVGELSEALSNDADAAFNEELTPDQQKIAEVMFRLLCERGGSDRDTRSPARLDHIARVASVKWQEIVPVVEVFRKKPRYFLTPRTGDLAPDTVLDISHESLIRNWKRLHAWAEDEALGADTYQRLVRDASEHKAGNEDLLSALRLASVNAWEKRFKPTEAWSERYGGHFPLAMQFLKASQTQREKEAREAALAEQRLFRKQITIKFLRSAFGVALLFLGFSIYLWRDANKQKEFANDNYKLADANYGEALRIKALLELRSNKSLSAWPYAVAAPLHKKNLDIGELFKARLPPPIQYYRQVHHAAEVAALAISPDGKLLAAALSNGSIDLIDPETGTVTRTFAASPSVGTANNDQSRKGTITDNAQTTELAFSQQGNELYWLRSSHGLEIRRLPDGTLLPIKSPDGKTITSFAFDALGARALGFDDGTLILYRKDGEELQATPLDTSEVGGANPKTGSPYGEGPSVPTEGQPQVSRQDDLKGPITSLAFASDGNTISGITGGSLCVWRIENLQLNGVKVTVPDSVPSRYLRTVLFAPTAARETSQMSQDDGKMWVASMSWSASQGYKGHVSSPITQATPWKSKLPSRRLTRSSSNAREASLASKAEIKITVHEKTSMQGTDEFEMHTTAESQLKGSSETGSKMVAAINPSGDSLFWVAGDGYLRAWWPRSENLLPNQRSPLLVKAHDRMATAVAISPSGRWLATGGVDRTTRLWRINTVESLASQMLPPIQRIAVDPQGKLVAIGRDDEFGTRIWQDGAIHACAELEPKEMPATLSDDGSSLVVRSPRGVRIFDVSFDIPILRLRAQIDGADLQHYDFNGPILAGLKKSDKEKLNVTLWDANTGKELGTFHAADTEINDMEFGSGRGVVAVAADRSQLKIWDIHDPTQPQELKSMSTGDRAITFISFARSENVLAAACQDNGVRLFDAKLGGAPVATTPIWESRPSSMTFNAEGTFLAIALENGTIKIWDCVKQRLQTNIPASDPGAKVLAFTSADQLVAAGSDRVIRILNLKGALLKTLGHLNWEPRTPDDAKRLSGLVLSDPLDVRFLSPEEEASVAIDAMKSSEDLPIAELWRAEKATRCNFAALEKLPELKAEEVEKADLLAKWLSDHKSSKSEIHAWVARAKNLHDTLFGKIATQKGKLGVDALVRGENARALTIFEQTLRNIPEAGAGEYRAWRGFARHSMGDERRAMEDREAYIKSDSAEDIEKWEYKFDKEGNVTSELLQLRGSFLVWLFPDEDEGYYYRALSNLRMKHYDEALIDVNAGISLRLVSMKPPAAANARVTPRAASFLLLRGRILDAQHSPNARKDWQQVADAAAADWQSALAHLYLGKFDSKQFDVAERYYKEEARKDPRYGHYDLARFFAVRSGSSGDKETRSRYMTNAIEELRKAGLVGHKLRPILVWTTDFDALQNEKNFNDLLSEGESVEPAPPPVASE
jgi:WD40 repeat protein